MAVADILNELRQKREKLDNMIAELEGETKAYKAETMLDVVKRVKSRPPLVKFETGVSWLDERMNGGFTQGTFINLAGENFAGKTYLAMQILKTVAGYTKVFFFSYEMYEGILERRVRNWSEEQLSNLLIEQKRNNIEDIKAIIRQQAKEGVTFFVIDSRMKIEAKGEQYERNSYITSALSKLTQELGITILLINQVSEQDLRNKRLSLKGSGDQAYDSDVIIYIAIERNKHGEPVKRRYICAKDRINERTWTYAEDIPVIEVTYGGDR